MRYLTLNQFYDLLGFAPLPADAYDGILERHCIDAGVLRYVRLMSLHGEQGDAESIRAFYRCYYGERVPELNIPWAELCARTIALPFERATLPELARFCDHPERRTRVLDLGCGAGLALCYLAVQFPETAFVGVDWSPEGLALARCSVDRLGLTNVTLVESDAFPPNATLGGAAPFDAAILRNVLDDVRVACTPFVAARFDTTRRLRAILPLLAPNARVWVSLTPVPAPTPTFEEGVCADLEAAGFTAFPPLQTPYTMGDERRTHLCWTICPRPHTSEPAGLRSSAEYVPAYHYPKGARRSPSKTRC